MRLIDKTDGTIMFDGENIGEIPAKQFARLPLRKRIQMVFQDPTDSLNPRFTAARAIADPILRLGDIKGRGAVRARCEELAHAGRPAARPARPLPAPAFRRAEGARRHRARHRAQARAGHSRRADRGARRLGAGGGAQPAAGPERAAWHELSVRVARPQRRAAAVRPGHRDARRQDRRGRADRAGAVRAGGATTRASCSRRSRIRPSSRSTRPQAGWRPVMTRRPKKARAMRKPARKAAKPVKQRQGRQEAPPRSCKAAAAGSARRFHCRRRARAGTQDRQSLAAGGAQPISRSRCATARWSRAFALPDETEPAPVFEA